MLLFPGSGVLTFVVVLPRHISLQSFCNLSGICVKTVDPLVRNVSWWLEHREPLVQTSSRNEIRNMFPNVRVITEICGRAGSGGDC